MTRFNFNAFSLLRAGIFSVLTRFAGSRVLRIIVPADDYVGFDGLLT